MKTGFDIFTKTLQLGEEVLGTSYANYRNAFDFSQKYYSPMSKNFAEFFEKQTDRKKGEYEYDLVRYYFVKAIEEGLASELYSGTSRGNVCDVYRSPCDIGLENPPTCLPHHLTVVVNSFQISAHALSKAVTEEMERDSEYAVSEDLLNAVMFMGQTVGRRSARENAEYKGYPCKDMLTRGETDRIAGGNFCKWLESSGYAVEQANFTRDTYQNVVAKKGEDLLYILVSAEVAPTEPGFQPMDIENLYEVAEKAKAVPCFASISLGSADGEHLKAGVILYGDVVRYRVNAFSRLE